MSYYRATEASVNIIIEAIARQAIILNAHLNHVEYSTLARASPPIIAPHVGVIKFTRPLADTKVITVTSVLYPSCPAKEPIIGVDNVARPDEDGTSIDKTT